MKFNSVYSAPIKMEVVLESDNEMIFDTLENDIKKMEKDKAIEFIFLSIAKDINSMKSEYKMVYVDDSGEDLHEAARQAYNYIVARWEREREEV